MNRYALMVAIAFVIAGAFMVAGVGFAYDIYTDQQNCQRMDAQPDITANCWSFPNKFFVAGGLLLGLGGAGLLVVSTRWYRNRMERSFA